MLFANDSILQIPTGQILIEHFLFSVYICRKGFILIQKSEVILIQPEAASQPRSFKTLPYVLMKTWRCTYEKEASRPLLLPVDLTSKFLGFSKCCGCLSSGDGVPALLGLDFPPLNFSVVVGAWVFVAEFSELSCVSEIFCHHHYHGHLYDSDLRVILPSDPASENQLLGSNLEHGRFLQDTLAHCWFTYNSKKFENIFYVQFWGR